VVSTTKVKIILAFTATPDAREKAEGEIAACVANGWTHIASIPNSPHIASGFTSVWTRSYKETDSGR
jgi:hypothetical protein